MDVCYPEPPSSAAGRPTSIPASPTLDHGKPASALPASLQVGPLHTTASASTRTSSIDPPEQEDQTTFVRQRTISDRTSETDSTPESQALSSGRNRLEGDDPRTESCETTTTSASRTKNPSQQHAQHEKALLELSLSGASSSNSGTNDHSQTTSSLKRESRSAPSSLAEAAKRAKDAIFGSGPTVVERHQKDHDSNANPHPETTGPPAPGDTSEEEGSPEVDPPRDRSRPLQTPTSQQPQTAIGRSSLERSFTSPGHLNLDLQKADPWKGWRILTEKFYLYYYNPLKNESVWQMPRELYTILGEWKEEITTGSGNRFWFNNQAQLSLWDDPRKTYDVFSAVLSGNTLFLHLFCECNGDMRIRHPETGASLVHYAVASGNRRILDYILTTISSCAGATTSHDTSLVNQPDNEGMEPLVYCVRTGYWTLIKPLVLAKADITNALQLARSANALESVRELVTWGMSCGQEAGAGSSSSNSGASSFLQFQGRLGGVVNDIYGGGAGEAGGRDGEGRNGDRSHDGNGNGLRIGINGRMAADNDAIRNHDPIAGDQQVELHGHGWNCTGPHSLGDMIPADGQRHTKGASAKSVPSSQQDNTSSAVLAEGPDSSRELSQQGLRSARGTSEAGSSLDEDSGGKLIRVVSDIVERVLGPWDNSDDEEFLDADETEFEDRDFFLGHGSLSPDHRPPGDGENLAPLSTHETSGGSTASNHINYNRQSNGVAMPLPGPLTIAAPPTARASAGGGDSRVGEQTTGMLELAHYGRYQEDLPGYSDYHTTRSNHDRSNHDRGNLSDRSAATSWTPELQSGVDGRSGSGYNGQSYRGETQPESESHHSLVPEEQDQDEDTAASMPHTDPDPEQSPDERDSAVSSTAGLEVHLTSDHQLRGHLHDEQRTGTETTATPSSADGSGRARDSANRAAEWPKEPDKGEPLLEARVSGASISSSTEGDSSDVMLSPAPPPAESTDVADPVGQLEQQGIFRKTDLCESESAALDAFPIPNLSRIVCRAGKREGVRPPESRPVPRPFILDEAALLHRGTGGIPAGAAAAPRFGASSNASVLTPPKIFGGFGTTWGSSFSPVALVVDILGTFFRLARNYSALLRSVSNLLIALFPALNEDEPSEDEALNYGAPGRGGSSRRSGGVGGSSHLLGVGGGGSRSGRLFQNGRRGSVPLSTVEEGELY